MSTGCGRAQPDLEIISMHYSRLAAATGVALLLAGGSLAIAQQSAYSAAPQAATESPRQHGGHGFHHLLTPEERIMWRMDHKSEMAAMSHDQRRAYKKQLREQFAAMDPREQAKVRDQLQQEWARLDPARQQKIEQRVATHQQRHAERRGGAQQPGYSGESRPPAGSPSGGNQL